MKGDKREYLFGGNRQKALERDNWQCVECGMNQEQHIVIFGRSLTVDHIDGKGRNSKNPNHRLFNLQTLCCRCHGLKDGIRNRGVLRPKSIGNQRARKFANGKENEK